VAPAAPREAGDAGERRGWDRDHLFTTPGEERDMTFYDTTGMRELASRIADGIHVRLLWSSHDDRVVVSVDDAKTGDAFAIDVPAGDRALEVFHHPYAYAA
jgi:hypothetical protein